MKSKLYRFFAPASLLLGLAICLPLSAQQKGTILGVVYDAGNGNPLPQTKVEITGAESLTATTDTDGAYTVQLAPGAYNLKFTAQGKLPATVEGVVVIAGEVADGSTVLAAAGEATQVEVTATIAPEIATAEALLTERKLADTVQDSISGEEIKNGTASDAAGALEKVTGVSVVNDSYVYVRGLGERYSSTTLNNSMLATTEPERRVVPLDLFPANLIDNIRVLKTYSPDLPGEFSAGLVQIETVEFPSAPTLSVSYTTGWNTQTHGNDFLTYPGGGSDFFGFDDGTRALPGVIPSDTRVDRFNFNRDELQNFGRAFADNWEIQPKRSIRRPTQSWNVVAGDTFGKLGIVGAVTFSNGLQSILNQDRIFYQTNPLVGSGQARPDEVPPIAENIFKYNESKRSVRLGAVFNATYRFDEKHKLSFKNFLSRDTDDEARAYEGFHQDYGDNIRNQRLRWIERQIFSTQLEGEHLFTGLKNSILSWQYSYSRATRDEPDLRENLYIFEDAVDAFEFRDDSQSAFRMFNNLKENIHNPRVDFLTPFYSGKVSGSVKFGASTTFRDRDFNSRRLRLALRGRTDIDDNLPPNELFALENIRPNGFELTETTRLTDAYRGNRDIFAYYGQVDVNFNQKWRFSGGLRIEDMNQDVTTFDQFNPTQNVQPAPFDKVSFLPSVNVTHFLTPKQNLRFGFSQTVSRPDFREIALFDFLDVTGGRLTVGNPNLVQTDIRNYDVRWEYFPGGNQLIAASFFFKTFDNPIERTVRATTGLLTSFDNADSATNYGIELEARRGLDDLSPKLRGLAVSGNFTFVDSSIDLTDVAAVVLTTRNRPMQGQSRYVGNAIVEWAKPQWRSTMRFYTNYFSSRITDVGALGLPDVYQQAVTTLDFVYELKLVESGKWKMRFSAENLNNPSWQWRQGGELFQRYILGRTFEVGTSFQVF